MSDASQGPGWWLASDGKWYPPEPVAPPPPSAAPPPPVAAPAPPASAPPPAEAPPAVPPPAAPTTTAAPAGAAAAPSSGNGCLKAFLIVFGVLVVIGVGLVILFAFVLNRAVNKGFDALDKFATPIEAEDHYEQQTGIASYPLGFDIQHPPQLDIWKRPVSCTYDSSTSSATASGTVLNHSGHPSSYLVAVSFSRGGTEVGTSVDGIGHVGAGATAPWRATGTVTGSGDVTCSVTLILRDDDPNVIPTTTSPP